MFSLEERNNPPTFTPPSPTITHNSPHPYAYIGAEKSFLVDYQAITKNVYSLTDKNLRNPKSVSTFASLTNNLKSILMSLNSLMFNISNYREIVTFVAHLGEKSHFVVMRNGELKTFDYASEFVDMANHYFGIDGSYSDSMSLDGKIYNFPHETMQVILEALLRQIEEKSQG